MSEIPHKIREHSNTFRVRLVSNSLHSLVGVVSISYDTVEYFPVESLTCEQTNKTRVTVMKLSIRN